MRAVALSLALLAALSPPNARAQAPDLGAGPILLEAEELRVEEATNTVIASGNVELSRGGRVLLADRIAYDRDADRVTATGNVTLIEPTGEALFADEFTITGDLRDGFISGLRGRLTDDSAFAAARGRRVDGNRTEMERVVYSPCELCAESEGPPLWQLRARRVIHDQAAQNIVYRDAFFDVLGVPIAYLPYFSHPDPTVERRTGLLAPTVGTDSELGFTLATPFYYAIAPYRDLTITPIVTTEEGPVLAPEYRERTANGGFRLAGSITYGTTFEGDVDDAEPGEREVRGHAEGDGRFVLAPGAQWGFDLNAASDDTYLQRYGFDNSSILLNRLFAERVWERNFAEINGFAFQGLRPEDDQGEIPYVLPLAEASFVSEPLAYGSQATAELSLLGLTRTEGLDTRRAAARLGWELPFTDAIGGRYRLRTSLRGDVYNLDGDPQTKEEDGTSTEARVVPRVTLDWSWPLARSSGRLTQVIEPIVSFSYAPDTSDADDIPNEDSQDFEFDDTNLFEPDRFTGLDRVEDGAKVSYGLRFGLYGPSGEWASALFGQSYRLTDDSPFPEGTGLEDQLSDYVGRLSLSPTPLIDLDYRFRLDQDDLELVRNEVTLGLGPPRVRAQLSYVSLSDEPDVDEFREREEVTAAIFLGLSPAVSLGAQTRRDLENDSTIANSIGIVYRNPCLVLVGGFERRFTRNRDIQPTTSFTVRVSLKNLGSIGS